jgi:glycosyltransferase involved in cell wall biosynthesis
VHEPLKWVLEIGSSSGEGSTQAFVDGLSRNQGTPTLFCIEISKPRFRKLRKTYENFSFVKCYNGSSVGIDEFPSVEAVQSFYNEVDTGLRKFPLSMVLDWRRQDIEYLRRADVETGIIEKIKADHGIETFDMVLIDGSEFTGRVEYEKVKGAKLILLDDTNTFKCYEVRQALLNDSMYDLIEDEQALRNGYSVFRRRDTPRKVGQTLSIHFLTIVLNGEPFIRYHEKVFRRLTVPWHWHVVEGVAALKHDTAWSVAAGGFIDDSFHHRGRSNDGTSDYLDELARRFPENISIYRRPLDEFWEDKIEMVNAPLANIEEECLLWQIDADELWMPDQIHAIHNLFTRNPDRTSAYYWCWYFIGPDKIVSTRHNYSQNPKQEWLRTWRYAPGMVWAAHAPPRLISMGRDDQKIDIAGINPFTHGETEQAGAIFQHFAYTTEAQLAFKESYYGYKGAPARWRSLQDHRGSGRLKDFFDWVHDLILFDDAYHYLVEPIAKPDSKTGQWIFSDVTAPPEAVARTRVRRPRIVVDGKFWQYGRSSGIGRVWENLLREWVDADFTDHIIVLDRAGTAPRIPGVHYITVNRHDYLQTGSDSLYLESICRKLDADLFVSTYYSTPTETPSFFFGHDMIPEVRGFELTKECWKQKRRAILHAAGHSMVSQNSANDLERLYPHLQGTTYINRVGVERCFYPPTEKEIKDFRAAQDLRDRRYVLLVGDRHSKNGTLVFQALAGLSDGQRPILICAGGGPEIEPNFRQLAPELDVRRLTLSDDELRAAYGGALALLYPSKYEGFGMPPLESMACGTPAVVCRNSSLPEVVGEAALYVDEDNPADMREALARLYDPIFRADLIERGLKQAAKFTFNKTATETRDALLATHRLLQNREISPPETIWTELRQTQQLQKRLEMELAKTRDAHQLRQDAHQLRKIKLATTRRVVQSMQGSPAWRMRNLVRRNLVRIGLIRR